MGFAFVEDFLVLFQAAARFVGRVYGCGKIIPGLPTRSTWGYFYCGLFLRQIIRELCGLFFGILSHTAGSSGNAAPPSALFFASTMSRPHKTPTPSLGKSKEMAAPIHSQRSTSSLKVIEEDQRATASELTLV
ncbi:unnamed protein product [Amaranthus hypochondriacus]